MMTGKRWIAVVAGLAITVGLPLAGVMSRRAATTGRCALDGAVIEPLYRVRIEDAQARSHEFCCIRCAQIWLERQRDQPRSIFVTDETSGEELPARAAHYVRSLVITTPATGNRIHAFRDRAAAERHADAARGTLLGASDAPFANE